jgi:hypothetical protein
MTSNGILTNSGNSVGSDTLGNPALSSGSSSLRPAHQPSLRSSQQRSSPLFRKLHRTPSSSTKKFPLRFLFLLVCAFLLGILFAVSVLLNFKVNTADTSHLNAGRCFGGFSDIDPDGTTPRKDRSVLAAFGEGNDDVGTILRDLQVLVVIVSFDFSQIPHLEEVLQGYHDICVAGAHVDVIVHATVPYPVTLMDLWNTRLTCPHFAVTIVLKPKSLRLFLVDEHRKTFYEKVHQYDLFIYTEDDIRLTPTAVASYMMETQRIESILFQHKTSIYRPSDFNVGIVRYEYNYPTNVIMDDNTRHATQNVTRVSERSLRRGKFHTFSLTHKFYGLCSSSIGVLGTQWFRTTSRGKCSTSIDRAKATRGNRGTIHHDEESSSGYVFSYPGIVVGVERSRSVV